MAAGSALAGSNPATLYACFDTYGNVRMSDAPQCKLSGGGRLVSWATVAAPGPTGPAGPTGVGGPTGPAGPAGSVVTEILEFEAPRWWLSLTPVADLMIIANCKGSVPLPDPWVGFGNHTGASVYVSGGTWIDGQEVVDGQDTVAQFRGHDTFQAAGPDGTIWATVTSLAVPGVGCRFIVSYAG